MAVLDVVARALVVAAALVARALVRRVMIAMTAMTAVVNSNRRGRSQRARHKVKGVVALRATACRSSLQVMPMSRVSRALQPVSRTRCALAWT